MLTKKWHNVNRLVSICDQEVSRSKEMWESVSTSELVILFLDYLQWCLRHDKYNLHTSKVTVEWMDKTKDGTLGHCFLLFAKLQIKAHLISLVKEIPGESETRAELLRVFANFDGYSVFQRTFERDDDGGESKAKPAPTGDGEDHDEADLFAKVKSSYGNKTSHALLDFLFDIFAGDHDKALLK